VTDAELVSFLTWALPRMGLRWRGFKDFRNTVRKRIARRIAELGLPDLAAYRARLEADRAEWDALDAMCRITTTRLYRDRAVIDRLRDDVLPRAAEQGRPTVRVWSAGCASGEEPYTIALVWRFDVAPSHPGVGIEIVATDADATCIDRARRAAYERGSLRELPARLRDEGLRREGDLWIVRDEVRASVDLRVEDLRATMPEGPFDVVLCRNVVFTYFDEPLQRVIAPRLVDRIAIGGVLVIGDHESIPSGVGRLAPYARCVFRRER
jgi:chemotaxis protein methyltransferase CheR